MLIRETTPGSDSSPRTATWISTNRVPSEVRFQSGTIVGGKALQAVCDYYGGGENVIGGALCKPGARPQAGARINRCSERPHVLHRSIEPA